MKSGNGVVGSTYPKRCIRNAEFAAISIEKLSGAPPCESSLPGGPEKTLTIVRVEIVV